MAFPDPDRPQSAAVAALQAIYGQPSQVVFGSAVFVEQSEPGADLEFIALSYYQYFVGELWQRFGFDAWIGAWQQEYVRPQGFQPDIVAELRVIGTRLNLYRSCSLRKPSIRSRLSKHWPRFMTISR